MVRRHRLPTGGILSIRKPRGRLKFESFDALSSYLRNFGNEHTLKNIVSMEMRASKDANYPVARAEVQARILMWWNTPERSLDVLRQRPSYVMTHMLRNAVAKRSK